ncbi:hypothetical protein BD770DRAFT_389586 [Pilaira anomala]|nr:hypothetical protein BD770DRAFT_389586 [Pilaira anomala]
MHADRLWVFSKDFVFLYSETDYRYKFWSYILELFIGRKQDVILRWSNTISGIVVKKKLAKDSKNYKFLKENFTCCTKMN